ncbi:MAG: hypothetical protein EOS51_15655 [Mesorhizobium sp.]|uniref:hypothetical protein n=1 Tax=unclassified Mesorhizobium TaxID=325217 RepID=UPI000FE5B312|nr:MULTISPECIES: hypothetical protein [unclassified Mesorhizobium]RWC19179.1 MAG: hypothetical protein EOS51_15655 [Mesorhizobium sp.]TGT93886.1 hypothetical protein EN807_26940 [Mesorhizobium sp. M5C.F.Ca.ET.164.01.1.1]
MEEYDTPPKGSQHPVTGVAYNEMEFRCEFPNRARYRLFGAVNPDGMRGLYLDRATKDEPADIRQGFHM